MKKVLFVSQTILSKNTGGGVSSERMLKLVLQVFDDASIDALVLGSNKKEITFPSKTVNVIDCRTRYSKLNTIVNFVMGFSASVNLKMYFKITRLLKSNNYDIIFFDGSLFGRIASFAKKNTRAKLITYYQNVEHDFFKDLYKSEGIFHVIHYLSACFNERIVTKKSDIIIVINNEDKNRVNVLYGREADLMIPPSVEKCSSKTVSQTSDELKLLFVGSAFFANIHGITWFIDNVMPYVDASLTVVGTGMDKALESIKNPKVNVLGFVEDLSEVYAMHQIVVVPIFSGAGMKVKIAEAFMYGKFVLSSEIAFTGYDRQNNAFALCQDAKQFIDVINQYPKDVYWHQDAFDVFNKYYSNEAVLNSLKSFFLSKKL
jgi:hypothetical protein